MTCLGDDEVVALVTGALDKGAFAVAEEHLDVCRNCRLMVSTLAARTGDGFKNGSLNAFGPGDVVAGRYQVASLLGSGGMGEVYETLDTVLGETVALKTLAAGVAVDQTGVARLKAEVQIARRVTHRNVCRVFDVGFHADDRLDGDEGPARVTPFFTMELLRGETLRKRVRRCGPLPCQQVLSLMEHIAAGLDAAHAAGIVHRDLKTENLMLVPEDDDQEGSDARVVITDFGLAHQLDDQVLRRMPLTRYAAGTLGYMAPEQLAGEQPRVATDIYALGVVLFELLTGELPFDPSEIIAGKERRRTPWAGRTFGAVPRAWRKAIERCLAVSPTDRFGSVGELLAELRAPAALRDRRRALTQLSLCAGLTVLVVGASVWAARRDARAPMRAQAVETTPELTAGPPLSAWSFPKPSEVGSMPRAGSTEPNRSPPPPPLRRSRHAPRPAGRQGTPSKDLAPQSATDRLGEDDFVDPFAHALAPVETR